MVSHHVLDKVLRLVDYFPELFALRRSLDLVSGAHRFWNFVFNPALVSRALDIREVAALVRLLRLKLDRLQRITLCLGHFRLIFPFFRLSLFETVLHHIAAVLRGIDQVLCQRFRNLYLRHEFTRLIRLITLRLLWLLWLLQ